MKIVEEQITIEELKEMASKMFGSLTKAVVDIEEGILVVDAGLHSDQEAYLLDRGSKQKDLWGINIHPELEGDERVEFDSMINLRPIEGNFSRGIDDVKIQKKILDIVNSKIKE
ncbi:MAG: DUF5674 family protein [Candidatus Dojkabacteria bacterium]|jgi:hypothetical protein|nr:DUF5674 family protein [Candidatus Dojkabacteria bacterium]MDD4561002.1 DUF5674 family protein [Candidatus Dojkabacteria bacterium]